MLRTHVQRHLAIACRRISTSACENEQQLAFLTFSTSFKVRLCRPTANVADWHVWLWICIKGMPDQTSQQAAYLLASILLKLDPLRRICRSSAMQPSSPSVNGMTERFNETLIVALRRMVADHQQDWDKHLPTIPMGYRGSIQASTHFSPLYLLHGYKMPLPVRALNAIPTPVDGQLVKLQGPFWRTCGLCMQLMLLLTAALARHKLGVMQGEPTMMLLIPGLIQQRQI